MKRFKEILVDIRSLSEEIRVLDAQIESEAHAITTRYRELDASEDVQKVKKGQDVEQKLTAIRDLEQKLTDMDSELTNKKIKLCFLKNNAKIALFHEVMPAALDVFHKYEGKSYGPKTEDKISNEICEKTGCRVYISQEWGNQKYNLTPTGEHEYHVTCGPRCVNGSKKLLLAYNKVMAVNMDDLELFYIIDTYYDDVDAAVKALRQFYTESTQKLEEYKKVCGKYNNMAVEGINKIRHPYGLPLIV